jgi:hypothetical protein
VFEPDREAPRCSETVWLGTWNADAEVGLFVHVGRSQQDLDLWWAQTVAFLPGGRLAVDRSHGRSPEPNTIGTGNLTIRVEEPGRRWSSTYDGAAVLTDSISVAKDLIGSGPARPMGWQLEAEAITPMWDLFGAHGITPKDFAAAGTHTQQAYRVSGRITVDGVDHPLDGVGYNDHSSGPRSMAQFGSHHFIIAVFPDRVVHSLKVLLPDGTIALDRGTVWHGEHPVQITESSLPAATDAGGAPRTGMLSLNTTEGDEEFSVETLHTTTMTITDEGDNLNGLSWDTDEDVPVFIEGVARFTASDGTVGYGHLERSIRRSRLGAPEAAPSGA